MSRRESERAGGSASGRKSKREGEPAGGKASAERGGGEGCALLTCKYIVIMKQCHYTRAGWHT